MSSAPPLPPAGLAPARQPSAEEIALAARRSLSPARRAWLRFKADRRGYLSLWILAVLFALSLGGELLSNDKPVLVRYEGQFYYPLFVTYPEKTFGGDFITPTDYLDPFIADRITQGGN